MPLHERGEWVLAASWAYSSPVATVDFAGLGEYQEIIVLGSAVTLAASGLRLFTVSADNCSTFITGANIYQYYDTNGVVTDLSIGTSHFTATAAARGFMVRIAPWRTPGAVKHSPGTIGAAMIQSTVALNGIRLIAMQSDYSTPTTFTGGSMAIWGRRA